MKQHVFWNRKKDKGWGISTAQDTADDAKTKRNTKTGKLKEAYEV